MAYQKISSHYLLFLAAGFIYSACGPNEQQQNQSATDSTAVTAAAPLTDKALIVPGESVGPIHLNDADSTLLDQLGEPDYSDAAMGKAVLAWYTTGDSPAYPVSIFTARDMGNDETARIQQIRITSPYYTTSEGICASSSLAQISAEYSTEQVEAYEKDGQQYAVLDTKQGIAFEVNPNDSCVAIIVYQPGAGTSSYLPLRTLE
ncbi:hypothetical protein [Parapedobacter lycopersici]|uniref:hypothetical protein n=1 Tax=Parapedobacter lycopersici TaxID=1864939 RepID=UPI00214D48FB|nr:hypothetical protein [Parapedobacter lycopersici]